MIILLVLMFLAPALIGVLLYERFKGYELILRKRVELLLVFAFVVNMLVYAVMWVRGWTALDWSSGSDSTAIMIPVVAQYMLISLAAASVLAYVLSLVRIDKTRRETQERADLDGSAEEMED